MDSFDVVWPSKNQPLFDFRFISHKGKDHIHDNFFAKGSFYEEDLLRFLATLGLPEGLVIDVGAYVGNHSIFFAGVMKRSVIALESNLDSFRDLCVNIKLNKLDSLISPLCASAADKSGLLFKKDKCLRDNDGSWRLVKCEFDPKKSPKEDGDCIESIALDDIGLNNVALVKIDVEGMEMSVLSGMTKIIEYSKPVLAVECMTALDFSRISSYCHNLGYLPVARKAATPVIILAHSSQYDSVCHGCPPPSWSSLVL